MVIFLSLRKIYEKLKQYHIVLAFMFFMNQILFFTIELAVAVGVFYALKWYLKTHRNDFEKRVEAYCLSFPLPEARQLYITKRKKIIKYIFIIVAIVFSLIPFLFVWLCVDFEVIRQMDSVPYELFGYMLLLAIATFVPCLLIRFYYLYYTINRTMQAQQLLLAEMSEEDFAYLEKVKQVSRLLYHLPPFMLCQDKLYIFKLLHIIEIPVNSIKNISIISEDQYNKINVLIEHTKRTSLTIDRELYSFLTAFMFKYRSATGYVAEGQKAILNSIQYFFMLIFFCKNILYIIIG